MLFSSFDRARSASLTPPPRVAARLRQTALLAVLALALPSLLASQATAAEEEQTAVRKLGRGLAAMTLGVLEIPGNVIQEGRTNGALSGITIGLAVGLGKFVQRELFGVYEFVTAPFEVPAGFKPILEPEFTWEYFESAPGRPYGFGGTYLASETDEIGKIPGAVVRRYRGALVVEFPSDLLFASESSELTEDAQARLHSLAVVLRRHPEAQVAVLGFADSTGSEGYNQQLSIARAASVRRILTSQGVASSRTLIQGYGERAPVASNRTSAGRQANRRVEIEVRASGVAAYH